MTTRPSIASRRRRCWPAAALAAIAVPGCVPAPPRPAPPAPTPPPATPSAAPVDWQDLQPSPGRWTYVASATAPIAQFARPGAAPDLTLACDRKTHGITLFRARAGAGTMTITTSYSAQTFPTQASVDGASLRLPATSDVLDRVAFSRGHVTVAAAGVPLLVLPAWAEPARVIEDCRG